MTEVLPDLLAPDLKVIFCGTAAGNESARRGAYYAGRGNKFWRTLHDVGLTPQVIVPDAFASVLEYGIGLTDLAKFAQGMDHTLKASDFGVEAFHAKIEAINPIALAFTSKKAGSTYYRTKKIAFGRQPDRIGDTVVFVLPSPSGAANRSWDVKYWQEVAEFVRR